MTDLAGSLALLLLASPLLLLALIAIVVSTRENPLFLQTRVGKDGRLFSLYKLRTMSGTHRIAMTGSKSPDDPRVTVVGRFLRRTSIDELPQLVNVLMGEMSLVGPRPALPAEVAEYPLPWRRALDVPPGLTGLWQVSGRSALTPRQRAVLDRCYLRQRSWRFDLAILLRTVYAVVSMRGAW